MQLGDSNQQQTTPFLIGSAAKKDDNITYTTLSTPMLNTEI